MLSVLWPKGKVCFGNTTIKVLYPFFLQSIFNGDNILITVVPYFFQALTVKDPEKNNLKIIYHLEFPGDNSRTKLPSTAHLIALVRKPISQFIRIYGYQKDNLIGLFGFFVWNLAWNSFLRICKQTDDFYERKLRFVTTHRKLLIVKHGRLREAFKIYTSEII